MRRDEKTYVIQCRQLPMPGAREWMDLQSWESGLYQTVHYTRKADAIAEAKRITRRGNLTVRVVQRIGAMLPVTGDGWTHAIVWPTHVVINAR